MLIGVPRETYPGENRVPMVPADIKKLVRAGADVQIESGMGQTANFDDQEYTEVGASVVGRDELLANADIIARLRKPALEEVAKLKKGGLHVSYLDPFNEPDLIAAFQENNITAISMEMIPRSTRSQKMDALSSQASLAGYVAVLLTAAKLNRILPMMMTPAGTLKPANVFIIGAGVAGLQAIATAKRMGAKVTAFDTRPVVKEQVESLGGKFLEIDLGETGQTENGYAKELTPEQVQLQREGQKQAIADSDIVITTAQLFGRPAPLIVPRDMVEGMKPGSVILDMAADTGGNVEGSVADQEVDINGVTIIGLSNLPNNVCRDASVMYSSNLFNLIDDCWDKEEKTFKLDLEHDILSGCIITHQGEVVNEMIKNLNK
jgi:NAD(P) transhydrogenase subunit alpha